MGAQPARIKGIARQLCPPLLWDGLRSLKEAIRNDSRALTSPTEILGPPPMPLRQDLDVYWSPQMGEVLDTWGAGTVWHEIQLLLGACEGRVLDIACGTGGALRALARFPQLETYGCDISDALIARAAAKGIARDRLRIIDATRMDYGDKSFDYAYSIGSLEHFTEPGIFEFLRETLRVTRTASFHLVPVSRSGLDEGWLKHDQSFFNNGEEWWLTRYAAVFPKVRVLPSIWESHISCGRWFVCGGAD